MRRCVQTFFLCSVSFFAAQPGAAQDTNDIPPLRPPLKEIAPGFWEANARKVILGSIAGLVIVAGAVALIVTRKGRRREISPEEAARTELQPLKGKPQNPADLSRVSGVTRRCLAHLFGLPPVEMTTAEFSAAMDGRSFPAPEFGERVRQFLRRCDERKFAPGQPAQDWDAAEEALGLIETAANRKRQMEAVPQ